MTIRILHHREAGYGWSFDSPDVPGLVGGTDEYHPAEAERAVRFALTCEAEERGDVSPEVLEFDHFVPADAAAA